MEKRLEIAAADFAKWHNETLSHTSDAIATTKQAKVAAGLLDDLAKTPKRKPSAKRAKQDRSIFER